MINTKEIDVVLEEIREALTHQDWERAAKLLESLRPPDQADLFEELSPETQDQLLPRLNPEDSADILEELVDEDAAEVAARLNPEELARILSKMESDEAADLLGDIAPDQAAEALLTTDDAEEIRPLLKHEDSTAGGLMTSIDVLLHRDITAAEAIAHLRTVSPDSETLYYLYVVDNDMRLVGGVSLRQLVLALPDTRISDLMDPEVIHTDAATDKEDVARMMTRYDLISMPVVDDTGHLLGVITHDDLVDVLEAEATEDIYRLGGLPQDQVAGATVPSALRNRLPWLVLNLGTAMASALVLSLFQNTIAQAAVLAAFFPIVAGVSGSAGTQTLTVIVRGLALGEILPSKGLRELLRELLIGVANGIVIGLLVTVIALVWKKAPVLGVIVGAATLLNMICAGIAGVLVPLGINSLKIDPALASPVLVTTVTDSLGYLIYLGLATLILLPLL